MGRQRTNDAVVVRLAHEHLGAVPELPAAQSERVQAILRGLGDDLGIRQCLAAVQAAGIACSTRQMKPFRDAEIWRRMGEESRHAALLQGCTAASTHTDPAATLREER